MSINHLQNLNQLNPLGPVGGAKPEIGKNVDKGSGFKEALESQLNKTKLAEDKNSLVSSLEFSNHAIDRMRARGLKYSPEELGRIESAVQKAAKKGSRETLVLTDSSALVVSVKNNKVVTVMDKNSLKENVFTNIDSTVVI